MQIENCFEQSVGVDNSRSMLALAKKNCKKSEFVACDVLNFNFPNKFNYITCTFDMINHLQTLQDWKLMFENVVKHLEDDGVFVFDYNTSFKFKDITQEESSHDDDRHIIRFKNTKLDDNHVECKIKVFNKENREKIAEITQIESFFKTKDIKKALKEAGFKTIKIVDKDLQPCKAEQEKRIFVICKK